MRTIVDETTADGRSLRLQIEETLNRRDRVIAVRLLATVDETVVYDGPDLAAAQAALAQTGVSHAPTEEFPRRRPRKGVGNGN